MADLDLPLSGVRIVDCVPGSLGALGRLLGELGADVIRVEPRGGGADRRAGDTLGGVSLSFAAANLGKRAIGLDLPADAAAFEALVAEADILLAAGVDVTGLRERHLALVILSISDFGSDGPWASWTASDAVLHALSGGLSRSGLPGREPLIPPGELTLQTACAQAAWVVLAAFVQRLRTGKGEHIDLSLLEAGMQALDPGFGLAGSAQSGIPLWKMSRGRVDERHRYPIFPCADGFVRLCILAPRQWRGMFRWMGEPEQFAGPEWERLQTRFRSTTLLPAIADFLADKTRDRIEAEAEAHGVPAAALLDTSEATVTPQMTARRAFVPVEVAPGLSAPFPNGTIEIDGARAGVRGPAPDISDARFDAPRPAFDAPPPADRPLDGVKVLDIGVIVVGGETGRLFADMGADVVKVENGAFPDGQRQSRDDAPVSITFAAGHRNKRGLSIDLKSDRGKALFLDLVREADVLLSNFKPGTLAALGFDAATLSDANPRLVTVDSSAFGPTGPWSKRLGYGPLVRCSAGLAKEWVYPGEPDSFSDAITVYPDHVAARIGAVGALALLIRRMRTGRGGSASVAQAEVMLAHNGAKIAALGARAAGLPVSAGQRIEDWLIACAGEDEWCVVTVRDDADRALLASVARGCDRISVERWAAERMPDEVMETLQAAGIPAGKMVRVVEMPDTPQYKARGFFRIAHHPLIEVDSAVEIAPAHFATIPDPEQGPAPRIGEHSVEILRDWLRLDDAGVAPLLADKIIEQAV
ncbi:CoA transferase [Sphingomonas sp. SUN019]|uniref:CaiB/BaiF CoA transferase family protein n=1 Tax=Sphingomonas sp. SUN019 TaxID=2937788 RepID=UPI002164C62C|nr:CoA transferase [Sphingomonas sp. SUN019]UVO50951.1 CoA transferase [Sphingomonas sp. SUN019]